MATTTAYPDDDLVITLAVADLIVQVANVSPTSVPHKHPIEDITGLDTALAGMLPLAGGQMTGQLGVAASKPDFTPMNWRCRRPRPPRKWCSPRRSRLSKAICGSTASHSGCATAASTVSSQSPRWTPMVPQPCWRWSRKASQPTSPTRSTTTGWQ